MAALGRHILVEFFKCDSDILNEPSIIEKAMIDAAKEADATLINSTFHHFSPYGVSGVVVIQESHLAIHTWPEYQYAAVDVFTCGDVINPWTAFDFLEKAFKASHGSAMEINRGQQDLLQRVDFKLTREEPDKAKLQELRLKREVWFTDRNEDVAFSIRHKGSPLFREKTPYQTVKVFDTYAYGKMLTIDGMVMTTERDEHSYHEMLIHPPMLLHEAPKNVLVIGGGDGGSIREIVKHDRLEKVTMVEIDEAVVRASKEFLPTLSAAFDHPKVELIIDDGIEFVEKSAPASYDLVLIDGSDPEGPAEGLFSEAFYRTVQRILKPKGLLCLQSEGPHFQTKAFTELNQVLKGLFGQPQVHTYLAYIPTYPTGMWSFMIAGKAQDFHPLAQFQDEAADTFSDRVGLNYYDAAVHRAAFALPKFVRRLLHE
ncbi:MAG: polyamine aminopropyltransferase [Bacteroidota bacterium]